MVVDKNDIQGDVWSKGFLKHNETYYFFSIADQKQKIFSQCLKKLAAQVGDASLITSLTQAQKDRDKAGEARALNQIAIISNAMIAFTRIGLDVVSSITETNLPGLTQSDTKCSSKHSPKTEKSRKYRSSVLCWNERN